MLANDQVIEDADFLTNQQKEIIKKDTLNANFPWYWNSHQVKGDKAGYFAHHLVVRPEESVDNTPRKNSTAFNFYKTILDTWCTKHNIEYEEILRMSINCVFPRLKPKCNIHTDHDFPHTQLIVYLTDSPTSRTVLLDTEGNIFQEIKPVQFKGVSFPKINHYLKLPTQDGRRIVVVYTFRTLKQINEENILNQRSDV